MAETEPFELGWAAGLRGDDPRACPYGKMTKEWNEWQRALKVAVAIHDVDEHLGDTAALNIHEREGS